MKLTNEIRKTKGEIKKMTCKFLSHPQSHWSEQRWDMCLNPKCEERYWQYLKDGCPKDCKYYVNEKGGCIHSNGGNFCCLVCLEWREEE